MGNCASNPKTNEAADQIPKPVVEDLHTQPNVDSKDTDNNTLKSLLDQKVEDEPKKEEVKAEEPKSEVVKVEEEKTKAEEEAKTKA